MHGVAMVDNDVEIARLLAEDIDGDIKFLKASEDEPWVAVQTRSKGGNSYEKFTRIIRPCSRG